MCIRDRAFLFGFTGVGQLPGKGFPIGQGIPGTLPDFVQDKVVKGVVLHPDGVKVIPLGREGNAVGEGLLGRRQVQKGQLETDGAVEVVEEIAPAFKDGGLSE